MIFKQSLLLAGFLLGAANALPSQEQTNSNNASSPQTPDIAWAGGITWTGHIEEGGEVMSFTGESLQDIETQIRELKPDFTWSLNSERESSPQLSFTPQDINCYLPWGPPYASVFHIKQGIEYLHKVHGNCTNGPGPSNCGRVSCSYYSGIFFCNDSPQPTTVPCSEFGDRAEAILTGCYSFGDFPDDAVYGQVFDSEDWNVVVAGAHC